MGDISNIAQEALSRAGGVKPSEVSYKPRSHTPDEGSFEEAFYSRIDDLVQRGAAVGITITDICKSSGIARATPDRWREKAPLSITLVDKIERAVVAAEAEAART